MRHGLKQASVQWVSSARTGVPSGSARRELDLAHVGRAEGESVEQFREQHHGGNIAVVRPHAAHGDEDQSGVRKSLVEIADQMINRSVNFSQRSGGRRSRFQDVEGMVFVHAVPQRLNRRVAFADYDYTEIPIGETLLEQPARSARTHLHSLRESFAGGLGLLWCGPAKSIDPFGSWIFPETSDHLLVQSTGSRGRSHTRIVSSPGGNAANIGGAREIEMGQSQG